MKTTHVRRRRSRRLPWLAILLTGAVGLAMGLSYAWFVNPVEYVDVEPSQLGEEQKRTYLILVSLAYASDGDLARARLRLGALGLKDDAGATLAVAADEAVTQGLAESSVRALTNLALALGGEPQIAMSFAGTLPVPPTLPATPVPQTPFVLPTSATPTATPTVPPLTPTPAEGTIAPGAVSPTPAGDQFALVDGVPTCDADQTPGLLVVFVQDASGEGLPGVEVRVQWDEGQDSFFTGLKPEQGPGYADFIMTEGRTYRVRVMDGNTPASRPTSEIQAGSCLPGDGADAQLSGYQLVFRERR